MATIQTIDLGTTPNDGTGDPLRSGGQKINDNFQNLNNQANTSTNLNVVISEHAIINGTNVIDITARGYASTAYKVSWKAFDSNGFEFPVRYDLSAKTAASVTFEAGQGGTLILTTQK